MYFSITIHLGNFFVRGKHLVFHYWAHVLDSPLPNLCIHWKPVPHNVKTVFMLRMSPLVLKVSLVISVRTSSEIIYHLTYLILTCDKSCILSYSQHCLPRPTECVQGMEYVLSENSIIDSGVESVMSEVTFTMYLFYFEFALFFEQV